MRIETWRVMDLGVLPMEADKRTTSENWDHISWGVGTDAESALDDLLHNLQEGGYDVAGLEGEIKSDWNPSEDEGDGETEEYRLVLLFDDVGEKNEIS